MWQRWMIIMKPLFCLKSFHVHLLHLGFKPWFSSNRTNWAKNSRSNLREFHEIASYSKMPNNFNNWPLEFATISDAIATSRTQESEESPAPFLRNQPKRRPERIRQHKSGRLNPETSGGPPVLKRENPTPGWPRWSSKEDDKMESQYYRMRKEGRK